MLKYMTDGMLLREFLNEPDLASYRSVHSILNRVNLMPETEGCERSFRRAGILRYDISHMLTIMS